MNGPQPSSDKRKDPEISAAELLFQEEKSTAAGKMAEPSIGAGPVEGFELADMPETAAPATPRSPFSGSAPAASASPAETRPRSRMVTPQAPTVDQVWSRGAEWGPSLIVLACWGALFFGLVYFTLGAELYGTAGLIFLAGIVGAVILSYPILITLERPVRVTPEQAARDYFGALSHHFPHYRRMWLLLSDKGRASPQYGSYEGFKRFWNARLGQLHEGHAGRLSPLVFEVHEFQSEKSSGKSEIEGRFRLRVLVRGRRSEGPIFSLSLNRSFVRGPDNMWYLNDGTLGEGA